MSEPIFYTHAEWRVRGGQEEAFIAAWRALSDVFSALASPPQWGTLLRSESDPRLFYSFGPWQRPEDIAAMRADPEAQRAIERLVALCERAAPGAYRRVAHVRVQRGPAP